MLEALNEVLARALHAADPAAELVLAVARAGDRLTAEERSWLLAADRDGLAVTSIIVKRLRFERALRGDPSLEAELERDPAAFAERWKRFAAAVPPLARSDAEEARAFRAFGG